MGFSTSSSRSSPPRPLGRFSRGHFSREPFLVKNAAPLKIVDLSSKMRFCGARADSFRGAIIREATFRGANKLHLPPPCEATAAAGDFCFRHFWRFFWGLRGKGPFGGGGGGPHREVKILNLRRENQLFAGGGRMRLAGLFFGMPARRSKQ